MSEGLKALENASRRDLQALAKKLQLCRGNAKSDVIVSYAMQFMDDHPKDGEQQVLGVLGGSAMLVTSPNTRMSSKKDDESNEQPEDEPTKIAETQSLSAETNRKDKEHAKSKHASSNKVNTTSPPSAASSAQSSESHGIASLSVKKCFNTSGETPPTSIEKKTIGSGKEKLTPTRNSAPMNKKAEIKARKAVEALVKSVSDLAFVGESRVRCSTTGHEMLADVNIISMYIHGKRYQKARNLKLSFAKYAPMFVDHPDQSKTDMLWCNVTESAIARDAKRVKDHMTAPKYQKRLPLWTEHEAAKKKVEEEANQRRAACIQAAKKMRIQAAKESAQDAARSERPVKRKRLAA